MENIENQCLLQPEPKKDIWEALKEKLKLTYKDGQFNLNDLTPEEENFVQTNPNFNSLFCDFCESLKPKEEKKIIERCKVKPNYKDIIKSRNQKYICEICDGYYTRAGRSQHLKTAKHKLHAELDELDKAEKLMKNLDAPNEIILKI